MNPKALALWHSLLDGTLAYPNSKDLYSLDQYYTSLFHDQPNLKPHYISALKENPYLLPNIDAFLNTMLYLHNLIDYDDLPETLTKMKKLLYESNDLMVRFYYNDYITYYFYNTSHQAVHAKSIALAHKENRNFNEYLNTGKATYE